MLDQLDLDQLDLEVNSQQGKTDSRLKTAAYIIAALVFFRVLNAITPTTAAAAATSIHPFLIGVAIAAPILFLLLWYVPRYRRSIAQTVRAREVLNPIVPSPLLVYSARFPWLVTILISLLLVAAAVTMNRTRIPEADAITMVSLLVAVVVLLLMSLDFFRAYPRLDRDERAFLRGRVVDWTVGIALFVFWLAIFPTALWQALDPFARDPMLLLVSYALAFLALAVTFTGNVWLPAYWAFGGPLLRGDYDGALGRVGLLLRFRPQNIIFKSWRGYLLLMAGRYDDAEPLWRGLLLNPQTSSGSLGIAASNLGYAFMGQGRFDEALPYLEVGVRISPELGSIYSGMASYYLRQQIEPERALEFMRRAVALTPRPKKLKGMDAYLWSSLLGSQAVAAVRSGDQSLADNSLNQAFADHDARFLPGVAGLHYDAGRVALSRGDSAGAQSHFTRAVELDPHGHVGKQASRALREMEAAYGYTT